MRKMMKESNEKYLVTIKDPDYGYRDYDKEYRSPYADDTYEDIYTALNYQDVTEYAMKWYGRKNRKGNKYVITIEDEFGNEEEFDPSTAFRFECAEIDEAYTNQAQMMTIRNQLMNKLGDEFTITGGTTVPKIIVASSQRPSISFEITSNGQNVDITPRIDNIPDTLHKKKGIAYMRAGNILYDFIMDTLKSLKVESVRKLYIRED